VDRFVPATCFRPCLQCIPTAALPPFADLEGRLSDADRDLLSSVVFADEILEEEKALGGAGLFGEIKTLERNR
jgi:hypothetical protein